MFASIPEEWPTVPSFIESLEFHDIELPWEGDLPSEIFLVHPMAIPQGAFITREQADATKPDVVAACDHPIYHADGDPVCIKSLWPLSVSVDQKGHRVVADDTQNVATIFTASGFYRVTTPIGAKLPSEYGPGIFASFNPQVSNVPT